LAAIFSYPQGAVLTPIQHENMSARRWPVVTLGLILLNIAVFLATHWVMEKQDSELWQTRQHILILAARHPELTLAAQVQEWVDDFRSHDPEEWAAMQEADYGLIDDWDARTRQIHDAAAVQAEMDSLAGEYSQRIAACVSQRYGFVDAHPRPIAYVTSNFLHGGWWHLIGNVWFLWLAGFVLEEAWGRPLYLLVYLAAGAAACQFDAWADPGSTLSSIGASGAIAGLMGAFLVRFPKVKIRMIWFFDLGLFPFFRFWMRAYWLLPFWALMEINNGMRPRDGIGHWAHVGGFLFGGVAAIALRYSGLDYKVNNAIEQKVSWTPAEAINHAHALMENKKLDEAAGVLNGYLETAPASTEAWNLRRAIHWQKSEIPAYRELTVKLCELHLQAREYDAGWNDYEEFLTLGGEKVPPSVWIELCRAAEEEELFERAVCECEQLAAAYPSERESLLAQLRAARLCLHKLKRPQDALRLYRAASISAVPHLDLEAQMESGIREAEAALSQTKGASAAAPFAAS
jgi:membrane associated rhomboid family serine protease